MSWQRTLALGDFQSTVRMVDNLNFLEPPGIVMADKNTATLVPSLKPWIIEPGEQVKNMATVQNMLEEAAQRRLGRDSIFVGAGGGVVCDMAAFAASLYMRGAQLILIPTSLLAMVDAAVGGKTGVDFLGWKNLVGTFYPANQILLWPSALKTLDDREYRCGMAEIIKHALLKPQPLWDFLESNHDALVQREESLMPELIRLGVEVKLWYVENDFRESGPRTHLNLGHTFAHALESATDFTGWKHGEAVAWGILRALRLGELLGLTPPEYTAKVKILLERWNYRLTAELADSKIILDAMIQDKKKKGGNVRFVLQEGPGITVLREAPWELVRQSVEEGLE